MQKQSPTHIAIILDGNRRFAKQLMLEPWKGHDLGRKKVEALLDYAQALGVKKLTLYALSVENIQSRPKEELDYLFKIFRETFKEIDEEKLKKNDVQIRFIGNLELLPQDLQALCLALMKKTSTHKTFIVNFALAYGGRQELLHAVQAIVRKKIAAEKIDEQTIRDYLQLADDPDLVIRTGGEKRMSNFLPWQTSYSEWFFLDKLWPAFEKEDLENWIAEFKKRKRNFGA